MLLCFYSNLYSRYDGFMVTPCADRRVLTLKLCKQLEIEFYKSNYFVGSAMIFGYTGAIKHHWFDADFTLND